MKKLLLLLTTCAVISSCNFFSKSSKKLDLIPYYQKDKYGYFDLEGKIVINPQFSYASVFRENIALVKTTGKKSKWGYIDKEGKYLINAIYTSATIFQEGIAWVTTENSAPIAINTKGETIFTMQQADNVVIFSEGLAAFSIADSTDTKWGFVDKKGIVKINPQFKSVKGFFNGKCAVENKEGKWGYIDEKGKLLINYQFDNAYKFIDGKAAVYSDDKGGIINEEGKYLINPQFNLIFNDGKMFIVQQDGKIGWVDEKGNFIINPQFEDGNLFSNSDYSAIKSGDQYGYIDTKGKIVINPQFDNAFPFVGGKAIVSSGDKIGVIDSEGKYVVNPQFDGISYDVFKYLDAFNNYGTSYFGVETEYFDVDKIIKIINVDNPEKLSFNDTFVSIAKKMNKKTGDFSNYGEVNTLIEEKKISNNAKYSFGVLGEAKAYNYSNYDYYITNNKPFGYLYSIELNNKAYGKVESLKKTLLKKFNDYTLVKKGQDGGEDVVVLKNKTHFIILLSKGNSKLIVYILNEDFDLNRYLRKIVTEDDGDNDTETVEYEKAVVDTSTVYIPEYD